MYFKTSFIFLCSKDFVDFNFSGLGHFIKYIIIEDINYQDAGTTHNRA